ncbi:hypothetical protein ACIQ2D_03225 [Lysinibacillus sp. NPDC097287]|uniref:hypothetical protein n=1 Tax=Lysinibacillus sp. NPDC097287 TaxID=3364144 RepID=UPI003820B96E
MNHRFARLILHAADQEVCASRNTTFVEVAIPDGVVGAAKDFRNFDPNRIQSFTVEKSRVLLRMNLLDFELSIREFKSTIEAFYDEVHNGSSEEVEVFTDFIYDDNLRILQCYVKGERYLTDISSEIIEASLVIDALYYQLYRGLHPKVTVQYIHGHTKKLLAEKEFPIL